MMILFSTNLFSQTRSVSGTVKDASGEPLIGVSVQLKGDTKVGTITDVQGKFALSVPANSSLIFSYMGYTSQILPASQAQMAVTLAEDTKKLDEIVVIGYGTVKKRDLTGAVSSVKQADIMQTPTGNAMEAIQGRIPGMDITRSSGSAGSGVNILIRGTKTIGYTDIYGTKTRNTEPLFVIDGVQGGSYTDLNPNDIESIDVLKDASSTAIYGSLGANGVVIITTKRGKADEKVNVTLDSYYGVNGWVSYPKSNTGEAYMNVRREAYRTVGQWASTADDYKIFSAEEWKAIQNNQWVDWRDKVTVQGKEQSHNITLSSNKGKVKTYFSLGYYNEQGVFKNDDLSKYSFRGNVDYEVNKWLQVGMNTQLTYYDQDKVSSSMLTQAMTYVPLGTPYNADGSINLFPVSGDVSKLSPLANYAAENKAVNNTISLKTFSTGYVIIQPTKELKFRSNVSATIGVSRNGTFNGQYSTDQYGGSYVNMAGATNQLNRYFSWDNILTYKKDLGDHSLEATGISSWTKRMDESYYGAGVNQLVDSYLYYSLNATDATSRLLTSNYIQNQTIGFAGRLSYNYQGKYFFTATGRWDGSSTLAPGHKWDFFPSASAAWRISDEPFMKGASNWLSNLKLRLSYGTTGNAGAPAYATQGGAVLANTKMGFNDTPASTYQYTYLVGNADLGWEKSTTTNLGLDFGILKGRVDLNVDLYNIDTKDILMARSLPPSTGAGGASSAQFSSYTNIGKTNNRGIEVALNTVNIQNKKFKWNSTVTFAANKEKIVSLISNTDIIQGQNPETSSLLIGRPINSFYSYKLAGVWQLGEEAEMAKYKLNGTANAFKPGDLKIVDANGDYNITTADRQYLGSTSPKWTAGLNNSISYKGFDLNVYVVARWGQMINAQFIGRYDPSGVSNFPSYFNYWTPENPSNDFPRPKKDGHLYDYTGYMSLNYVNGSYFKVKTVSLGYTIPASLTRKVGISKFRLYATTSNILTVASSHMVKYYDPERGGDETMPLTKQLVFGANVSF
jgi:TonB-linked SusC/RagA family outer membrane protein